MLNLNNCLIVDYDPEILYEFNKFRCNNHFLDEFLYNEDEVLKGDYGYTRLVIERESKDIIGFFTICSSAISLNPDFKDNTNIYSEATSINRSVLIRYMGAIGLSCFAVNSNYRGQYVTDGFTKERVSEFLLKEAFAYIIDIGQNLNVKYVILSSTKEGRRLYYDYGFNFLDYEHRNQYLSYKNIEIPEVTVEEKSRKNRYIFNINSSEIDCYQMMFDLKNINN